MSLLSYLQVIAAQSATASSTLDVWICAGQSNMSGYTGSVKSGGGTALFLPAGTAPTNTNLPPGRDEEIPTFAEGIGFFWDGTTFQDIEYYRTHTVTEATAQSVGGYYHGYRAGMFGAFVKRYNELTGRRVLIIDHSFGDSGVCTGVTYSGGNWADTHRGTMLTKWNAFKSAASTAHLAYTFKGLFWCQGEAEVALLLAATKTEAQVQSATETFFSGLSSDYGSDYHGSGKLINVILTGVYGGDAIPATTQDKLVPDTIYYETIRRIQRTVGTTHAAARIAFWSCEAFYFTRFWGNNYPTGWTEGNTVHLNQSMYNTIGRSLAADAVTPDSLILAANPPTGLTATADGSFRVKLSWTAPASILGTTQKYNIYRRTSGASNWDKIWIYYNATPAVAENWGAKYTFLTSYWDEERMNAGTTYEYRVGFQNEFSEGFSDIATVTTAALAADVIGAYNTLCSPSNLAKVMNLYGDFGSAGITDCLRQLYVMQADTQASSSGSVYNLIRSTAQATRYDLTEVGATRGATGFALTDTQYLKTSTSGLLSVAGPFTLLLAFKISARTGPATTVAIFQNPSYVRETNAPVIDQYGTTLLSMSLSSAGVLQHSFTQPNPLPSGVTIANDTWYILGLVYDGSDIRWYRDSSTPTNTLASLTTKRRLWQPRALADHYIWAMYQANNASNYTGATLTIAAIANWTKALTATEYLAARSAINTRLGLGL